MGFRFRKIDLTFLAFLPSPSFCISSSSLFMRFITSQYLRRRRKRRRRRRRRRRRKRRRRHACSCFVSHLLSSLEYVPATTSGATVTPKEVGLTQFGPSVLAVEIASMLLLAGLVGAYHLGRRFIVRGGGA